jgi:NhaP-type Na+/H+ or K+/H+ antiporter
LALLKAIGEGEFQVRQALMSIGKSFGISLGIGLVVGMIWSNLLDKIRSLDNSIFLVLAFVLLLFGAVEFMGWNGSLAVLAFGIMLGNAYLFGQTPLKRFLRSERLLGTERNFFSELVFVVQTYFFVYVGLSIQFGDPIFWAIGMMIVVIIIALRPLGVWLFIRQSMPLKDYSIMGVLSPKGLVPAVLAGAPYFIGLETGNIALQEAGRQIESLAYAIVLLSILLSSGLVVVYGANPLALGYPGRLFTKRAETAPAEEEKQEEEASTANPSPDADTKDGMPTSSPADADTQSSIPAPAAKGPENDGSNDSSTEFKAAGPGDTTKPDGPDAAEADLDPEPEGT